MLREALPERVLSVAEILDGKKAQDIILLKVDDLTIISDYFVVASATSTTHAQTLADEVGIKMKQNLDSLPLRTEGEKEGRWIVMDYGDILVHIFHKDEREFYQLERLWKSGDNFFEFPG